MVRSYVAALALLALVTGCSGDEEEPAPAAPTTSASAADPSAIRSGLVALWVGDDDSPEDVETGTCFADALVDATTPDELVEVGILDASYAVVPELTDLTPEGAGLWVDAQFGCSDLVSESGRAQVAATKGKVDRESYETCLRAVVSEEQLREVAESSLLGDLSGDAVVAFSAAQLDCVQQALPRD